MKPSWVKLLLDENLPTKLKNSFSADHDLFTVKDLDWVGVKNGELLKRMQGGGFDALITIDKNLRYQQNIKLHGLKVCVLNAVNNKLSTLTPFIARLEEILRKDIDDAIIVVNL